LIFAREKQGDIIMNEQMDEVTLHNFGMVNGKLTKIY